MQKFNLLGTAEKLTRDVGVRKTADRESAKLLALKFGFEYFDGTRDQGYGGYTYDGRWVAVARRIIDRFDLVEGARVLDVGCAKGFLMHDLKTIRPDIEVKGVDISEYAKINAVPTVKDDIILGSCVSLPFPNDYFDASLSINTIHNMDFAGTKVALEELMRVTKNKSKIFIQVDAYTNEKELEIFKEWVLTAKTYLRPVEWEEMFNELGYEGDYFWTIIGFEEILNS